jgi:WD40 repeat protein
VAAADALEARAIVHIRIFDTRTGTQLAVLDDLARAPGPRPPESVQTVGHLEFSSDGRALVANDGAVGAAVIWDLTTYQARVIVTRDVGQVSFLADGRLVLRGLNFRLTIHDPATLLPVAQLSGRSWASVVPHPHPSRSVLLSDNGCGNFDAQASTKTGTTLWDLDKQVEVGVGLALWCSSWSPDGTKFVAMDNASIQIWSMDVADWQRSACLVAARNLTDDEWTKYGPRTGGDRTATCPD